MTGETITRRDPTPLTIRIKPPGLNWVNVTNHFGTQLVGDPSMEIAMPGGFVKASFTLAGEHRIIPGTQVAFWDGLAPCGSGEVQASEPDPTSKTTPVSVRGPAEVMSDSIIYDKTFVIQDLSKFIDVRSTQAARHTDAEDAQEWNVVIDAKSITVGAPNGQNLQTNTRCGAVLDLGPNNKAKVAAFDWSGSNNFNIWQMYGIYFDSNYWATAPQETIAGPFNNVGATGAVMYTATTAMRFFQLLFYITAPGATIGADVHWKIITGLIATSTAWNAGTLSILRVHHVATDIIANAGVPNISTRTDLIATGTFNIAELVSNGDNPKNLLDRANAAEGFQWRFTPDATPALEMRAKPTTPKWVLRPGDYSIERGQANDLQDVYNRVQVFWKAADGSDNVTTVTLTPDTTILARLGRTRTATVKISRVVSSAEAAGIGALFLREHRTAPLRAAIKLTQGYVRSAAGIRYSASMMQAGDMVRLLGMRDAATGLNVRDGLLYGAQINPRTSQASISLDSDTTIFDRQLAYFESLAAS